MTKLTVEETKKKEKERDEWDKLSERCQAQLAKSQEVCLECKGRGLVKIVTQTDPPDTWLDDCPTCQGTGKKGEPDTSITLGINREKIANRLWWLDNADEEGFDTEEMAVDSPFYTQVMRDIYLRKADQILALQGEPGRTLIDTEAIKREELERIIGAIENISSVGYPYGGDYKRAILQALMEGK